MRSHDATIVGRLRVQQQGPEGSAATAARLRVARLLQPATIRPPGLPPSSVLIVHHLADPLPGRLANQRHALAADIAWQRAMQGELLECYRRAARPIHGFIPANATAVCFADESELMACLARDLSRGLAEQCWWWQTLLRSAWGGRTLRGSAECLGALVQQLIRHAHLAPAVLVRLQEWGDAANFVRMLTPIQARAVLDAVLHAHSLPGLPGDQPGPARPQLPPWQSRAQPTVASTPSLGRVHDALFGVALDLIARPHMVASPTYQRHLHAWWYSVRPDDASQVVEFTSRDDQEAQALASANEPVRSEGAAGVSALARSGSRSSTRPDHGAHVPAPGRAAAIPPAESRSAAGLNGPDRVRVGGSPWAGGAAGRPAQPFAGANKIAGPGSVAGPGTPGQTGFAKAVGSADSAEVTDPAQPADGRDFTAPDLAPAPAPASPTPVHLLWADGVPTQVGGVLYLINLMAALDLPDCCEPGWRLASSVGAWGLLHALGQELLAGDPAALDDPLWLALAHLDARLSDQAPGFRLPRSRPRRWPAFELPAGWFKDLGFDTAGTPTQPTASARSLRWQAAGLGQRYRPLLARWLALALPFIDLRLRLALDLPHNASLPDALLWLPGHLYVTRTHVDLVTSLEHISLPVRLAGLDRNPGWLPRFARVVTFHFE